MKRVYVIMLIVIGHISLSKAQSNMSLSLRNGDIYALDCAFTSLSKTFVVNTKDTVYVDIKTKLGLLFTVKEVTDGYYKMTGHYNHISFKGLTPDSNFYISTDNSLTGSDTSRRYIAAHKAFQNIINQSFSLTINKQGAITQIVGLEELVSRVIESTGMESEDFKEVAPAVQMFSGLILLLSFKTLSTVYPNDTATGETWNNHLPLPKNNGYFHNEMIIEHSNTNETKIVGGGSLNVNDSAVLLHAKKVEFEGTADVSGTFFSNSYWPKEVIVNEFIKARTYMGALIVDNLMYIDFKYWGRKIDL